MTASPRYDVADLAKLFEKLDSSLCPSDLEDSSRRRGTAYASMAKSSDPILREIGEQLRSGRIAPRDLLCVPEYRDALFGDCQSDRMTDLLAELKKQLSRVRGERHVSGEQT